MKPIELAKELGLSYYGLRVRCVRLGIGFPRGWVLLTPEQKQAIKAYKWERRKRGGINPYAKEAGMSPDKLRRLADYCGGTRDHEKLKKIIQLYKTGEYTDLGIKKRITGL